MTEAGKRRIVHITLRRMEIPIHLYEVWLMARGYKRLPAFWEHAR